MPFGKKRDETGAIAILFAACAIFLFVLAAMVIDLGLARETRRESQNAADAAALAAANRIYLNSSTPDLAAATAAAKSYAEVNFDVQAGDWAAGSCTDPDHLAVLGAGTECISYDSATDPRTVRVRIPTRNVDTGFGELANVHEVPVSSIAEAGVAAATNYNCALCFLGSIDMRNSDFTVTGGGIQVSGDVDAGPNAYWNAGSIGVSGTTSGGNYSPAVTKAPAFTDPLASLTLPTMSGTNRGNVPNCNTTIQPGVYGTLDINNNSTCTLAAGKYVITGKWGMGNNSVLQGSNVTLYFVCGTSAAPAACTSGQTTGGGWIDAKNGTLSISAGAPGFTDYAIIYDRNNPNNLGLQGNGGTQVTGAVYAPKALLDFNGNSQFGFTGGPVVVLGVNFANGNFSGITVSNAKDITAASKPGDIALSK